MARITTYDEIKTAYELASKKYKKLPKFDEINNEFEIVRAEFPEFMMKETRRMILRIFNACANDLQAIFNAHPQDPHSMIESSAFSKEEKQKIYKQYMIFWYWIHQGLVDSMGGEKESAEFVINTWKAWPPLKKEYKKVMQKVTKAWKKVPTKPKEDKAYLG